MMVAAGAVLALLGLVGVAYGIYALVRGEGARKEDWGLSPSAPSTRWRASGC